MRNVEPNVTLYRKKTPLAKIQTFKHELHSQLSATMTRVLLCALLYFYNL